MKRIITLLHCIIIVLFLFSCSTTKKSQTEQSVVNIEFNADSAYAFCAAQCSFGPRTMNSEAHELCSEWIQQKFSQYGYQVELQKADLKGYNGTILKSTNIIAHQPSAISHLHVSLSAPTGTVVLGPTTIRTRPIIANP